MNFNEKNDGEISLNFNNYNDGEISMTERIGRFLGGCVLVTLLVGLGYILALIH